MKKFILAALALVAFSGSAKAQIQTYILTSSCTYSGTTVSTGTWARRIDNLNKGAVQALIGRNLVRITTPGSSKAIYVGYDSSISTVTTSANYARTLSTGAAAITTDIPVPSTQAIYALTEDSAGAAGQRINVEQCKPTRQNGE